MCVCVCVWAWLTEQPLAFDWALLLYRDGQIYPGAPRNLALRELKAPIMHSFQVSWVTLGSEKENAQSVLQRVTYLLHSHGEQ